MGQTVYLVTADGYGDNWGAELYAVGIYQSEDKANEELAKLSQMDIEGTIVPLELNKTYPLEKAYDCNDYSNGKYLGGYYE